ncbi:MAG: acyltransferase [Planctomycetaceae bacterium]|nr:acyltransferase [Planctomycetaceae bacterium]
MSFATRALGAFSRVTSSGKFITEIDALRFIAIVSVLNFHARTKFFPDEVHALGQGVVGTANWLYSCGWFGVQLFFVISGFILCTPFAEHHLNNRARIPISKYFLRRVTRLEPPYIINLVLLLALMLLCPVVREPQFASLSVGEYFQHFAASLAYSHNLVYQEMSYINWVTWTLEIEVQFYILAPLLAGVFALRRAWLRRGVLVGAIALSCFMEHRYYMHWTWLGALDTAALGAWWHNLVGFLSTMDVHMTLLGQIRFFLVGFLLADIYLTVWKGQPRKCFAWDAAGAAAWAVIPVLVAAQQTLPQWLQAARQPFWTLAGQHAAATALGDVAAVLDGMLLPAAMLLAYVGAFRGRLLNVFFRNPLIATIGGMCYTIYLYHGFLIEPALWPTAGLTGRIEAALTWRSLVQSALMAGFVVAAAGGLFLLFEKPFMYKDWPARLSQRWLAPLRRWRSQRAAEALAHPADDGVQVTVEEP